MRVTILGSGTSIGVPVPACGCSVCRSDNPKNKRLRTSIFIQLDSKSSSGSVSAQSFNLLVDSSTDLRQQALAANISRIDAVIYTHAHADHIFGIDDLRSFNFRQKSAIPLYADDATTISLQKIFQYAFEPEENYLGGALPQLTLHRFEEFKPIVLGGHEILPIPIEHGRLKVFGFRIGNFAYLTDCSKIPDESRKYLSGLEVLVLDGLREQPHNTHFSHEQAVKEVEQLQPKQTYLIHISHDAEHENANRKLNAMTKFAVELAYDGLVFDVA